MTHFLALATVPLRGVVFDDPHADTDLAAITAR